MALKIEAYVNQRVTMTVAMTETQSLSVGRLRTALAAAPTRERRPHLNRPSPPRVPTARRGRDDQARSTAERVQRPKHENPRPGRDFRSGCYPRPRAGRRGNRLQQPASPAPPTNVISSLPILLSTSSKSMPNGVAPCFRNLARGVGRSFKRSQRFSKVSDHEDIGIKENSFF